MPHTDSPASTKGNKVVVFGGSGHTGRFVISELVRRGMMAILAGRHSGKLLAFQKTHPSFEMRIASVDDPASLDQARLGLPWLINCCRTVS
jgi:short subunit dehydrogenase-like uncharacterized protein